MKNILVSFVFCFTLTVPCQTTHDAIFDSLKIKFSGDAIIETGNQYLGIEAHHSCPMLQRISFFYPSANSIDMSTDYWKRDSSFIMAALIKNGNESEWLNFQAYEITLTPFSVSFFKQDSVKKVQIDYNFCKEKPAMVVSYEIENVSSRPESFEFRTHYELSLKTSHSYKSKDKADIRFDENNGTIFSFFNDPETQYAEIFVSNAGDPFSDYYIVSPFMMENIPSNWWEELNPDKVEKSKSKKNAKPAAGFSYKKYLQPSEKMRIIHIVGSSKKEESKELVDYLKGNFKNEVQKYKNYIPQQLIKNKFTTGVKEFDKTVHWSNAILEVNRHFIDGSIQPMPCPAEYNFYFTHDVLLTDLGAVNFDLERVKKDLQFIIEHADDRLIIPHAYYWKDSVYVTEFATPDNWNHFWFILLSGTYLRHSNDLEFIQTLYPYISKSLEQTMLNKKNNLMWAYRPDWWDIGRNYGPRSFMTILAIKALREYIYMSLVLKKNLTELSNFEDIAMKMQKNLNDILWSNDLIYLMNFFENNVPDYHYYIGSLLAAHFNLLDQQRKAELVKSAKEYLLDEKIGIYNVYPMNFEKLTDFLKFAGNEAGDPFVYANGGIWPHGNAWYALALIASDQKDDAYNFTKNISTINGIINSPNGQPAMYEYRNSNYTDPKKYGKIDKPQFMWAAGWYLFTLYHMFGISENEWNISLNPYLNDEQDSCIFYLTTFGQKFPVTIKGKGKFIKELKINDVQNCSAVLSGNLDKIKSVQIILGIPGKPYLAGLNSILLNSIYKDKTLLLEMSAYSGHKDEAVIISPFEPLEVKLNNLVTKNYNLTVLNGVYKISVPFLHDDKSTKLEVKIK